MANTVQKESKVVYLQIGQNYEHLAETKRFDVSEWVEAYPDATIYILFRRPGEDVVAPVQTTLEDGILTWTISNWETGIIGVGFAEIRAIDSATGLVKKSHVIPCSVEASVTDEDIAPDFPSWIDRMITMNEHLESVYADFNQELADGITTLRDESGSQQAAIQAKGVATIASIPMSYTDLIAALAGATYNPNRHYGHDEFVWYDNALWKRITDSPPIVGPWNENDWAQAALTAHVTEALWQVESMQREIYNSIAPAWNYYDSTASYAVGDYVINRERLYRCISPVSGGGDFDYSKWEVVTVATELQNYVQSGAIAPAYSASTTYTAGQYVWYSGNVYRCKTDISTAEAWTAAHWQLVKIGDELTDLKSAINAYVGNLVNDFTWIDGKSFNLSTGEIKTQTGFHATYRVLGSDFTEQFNYESISGTSSSIVAMWLNGTYVGYYWRLKYYNPSSTEIAKPNYNEWALSAGDSYSTYHLYTIAYQRQITALQAETQYLYEITQPLADEFIWSNGYYSFTTGDPAGATTQYHRTNKMQGSQYIFADSAVFDGSSSNFISFWYQGTYAGYYLAGKYYNPSKTQVESITYDEWATNIYTNNYAQLKPNSLGNRVTNLENREQPSPLQGKKLGCIGDSIAAGAGFSGGYGGIIANDYGMTIDNNAINGSVLVPQQSFSTIIPQLNSLDSDCDYVILEGGFNDSWLASPIGVYGDSYAEPTADDTFYGNLNYLLYTAVHKYAGKKICYLIVHAGKTEYSCMIDTYPYYEATVKLCKKWGVPVVDLNQNCVPFGLLPSSDSLRTTYTANSGDGVHPNEAGYRKYYVPQIVAMLESL